VGGWEDEPVASERDELTFPSPQSWRAWLGVNHGSSSGIWLRIAKKHSGIPSVTHDEAVDEALCYGWIDGQRVKGDDTSFLQRFTPRTRRSPWSKINTDRVERLIRAKKMRAPGLRAVEAAKADGRWDAAYAGPAAAVVPDDLQAALDRSPEAAAVFRQLDSRNRYAILYRIGQAKKPETRARRVDNFVRDLEAGTIPYPNRRR
jgi:uncharacterized protein YdeI (YjbR/CyaY-like superfamily)